jgi:hypothetical protein
MIKEIGKSVMEMVYPPGMHYDIFTELAVR